MSDSLQDQLLALGLAKDKPRQKPRKDRKARRPQGGAHGARNASKQHAKQKSSGGEISLDAAYRARQKEEKRSAEQLKAEKRALDLERRRVNGEIDKLLKGNTLNDREGDLKRNFLYKGKIRSVRVNAEQLKALNEGSLCLVFLRGDYLVVTPELAASVRALSPDHVPELVSDEPDPEEFPVPDDLTW